MFKFSAAVMGILLSAQAFGSELSYEVCTDVGACALRVTENGEDIWLVREDSTQLSLIWGGSWWVVSDQDYELVLSSIPTEQRWGPIRAIDPTNGVLLREAVEKKGTPAPAPSSGPLIGGTITVTTTIGGGSQCTDCHKGSHHDIHKKKLNDGGK